jgi:glycosyltransferase involved in cell wall biosynthesis
LSQAKYAVTVWTTNALDLESFWSPRGRLLPAGDTHSDGIRIRRFPLWRMHGRRWLLKPLSLIPQRTWQAMTLPCNPISFAMRRAVNQCGREYDAVHATAFPYAWPILCGRRLARRLDVPFFLTPFLHLGNPDDPNDPTRRQYTAPLFRSLLRSADIVFAQTTSEREAIAAAGVPHERIVLQGLGVDPAECTGGDRRRARTAWSVGDDEVVVGHLANNSREKGTTDLVRACDRLAKRRARFRLALAGPRMPNFAQFMRRRPPARSEDIIQLGSLSDDQKRDFLAGIDVFALPSRSDSFGLVLLEAWANGVPNVVYRAGGPADLVRHGIDGLQAPCSDIDALADQLERMILDSELRMTCGRAGLGRVESEFRWSDKLRIVQDAICAFTKRGNITALAEAI